MPKAGPLPALDDELVESRLQLGAVLPDHPCHRLSGGQGGLRCYAEARVDLLPEIGQVTAGDRGFGDPGVDHLEEVLVGQVSAGTFKSVGGRLARGLQALVQLGEVLVVDGDGVDQDGPAREVLQGLDGRGARRGHHDFPDILPGGDREEHLLLALGGHDDRRDDHIAPSFEQGLEHLVLAQRDEDEVGLQFDRPLFLIEILLEGFQGVIGRAPLGALVHEIGGPARNDEDPDHPALEHPIQVSDEFTNQGRALRELINLLLGPGPKTGQDEKETAAMAANIFCRIIACSSCAPGYTERPFGCESHGRRLLCNHGFAHPDLDNRVFGAFIPKAPSDGVPPGHRLMSKFPDGFEVEPSDHVLFF